MRKVVVGAALLAFVAAACASSTTTSSPAATGSVAQTAQQCAAAATFVADGKLTVGTDSPRIPAVLPGRDPKGSQWDINDPSTGKGFESAVAYEIAKRMGFAPDQVKWVIVPFAQSYAPGPKDFDLDINQISYSTKRAQTVDFSESYYDVNQAVVVVKGTPIASATTVGDLAQYKLATQIGTTSADLIESYIGGTARTYQTLRDAVAAVNAGQADGLVVDYPTALYNGRPVRPGGEEQHGPGPVPDRRRRGRRALRDGPGQGQHPDPVHRPRPAGDEERRDVAGDHRRVALEEDERREVPVWSK
jgi:polar amino acid transport system substrate-binding protein